MRYLAILAFFVSLNAQAIDTDKAAHLGLSYMATTLTYGAFKAMGVENKVVSTVFAGSLVGMVTTMKEVADKKRDDGDLAHNALGIGLSVGTILVFDL